MTIRGWITRLFGLQGANDMEERIKDLESQTEQIKEKLDTIAAHPDPFASLVKTMRQANIQRRTNGPATHI